MEQFVTVWNALSPARRVMVAIATIVCFATVILLSRMASTPTMALLYAGLEDGAAAYLREIGALADKTARPWFAHPFYGEKGARFEPADAGFRHAYAGL